MNKLKIFLSSRVNSSFTGLDAAFSLETLRKSIRKKLEAETFLNSQLLEVVINEENFNGTIRKNAFDNCMEKMRECNVIIILYSGEAGWSIADSNSTNGICHEEFLIAMAEFSDMSFMINISSFFPLSKKRDEQVKNEAFAKDITDSFPHAETIKATTVEELEEKVLTQTRQYILKSIEKSFKTQKAIVSGASVFGDTLDWSKFSYSERNDVLEKQLEKVFTSLTGLNDVIKAYHAIPDNMSVSDARNSIGRPFIHEHKLISGQSLKSGVIHFVGVYGTVTEMQVKTLVGYPDLTVIKGSFGFYLWEKNMHIQMFFLKSCINPQTIKTRYSELTNWLTSSREVTKIAARAKARFLILEVINNVNNTA